MTWRELFDRLFSRYNGSFNLDDKILLDFNGKTLTVADVATNSEKYEIELEEVQTSSFYQRLVRDRAPTEFLFV